MGIWCGQFLVLLSSLAIGMFNQVVAGLYHDEDV